MTKKSSVIQGTRPHTLVGPTNLAEFFKSLTYDVKFTEFEKIGKMMFHQWCICKSTVLVLNTESVIDIRTLVGLGEMLLAEVSDSGEELYIVSWMYSDYRNSLIRGFNKAAQESVSR